MKTTLAIATAAVLALAAGHAAAQSDAPMKATVSYADLDLSRATGREALERRIGLAVSRVCQNEPSSVDLKGGQIYRACRTQAWAGARQQLAMVYGGSHLAAATITVGPGTH